jgi:hypothetical protein
MLSAEVATASTAEGDRSAGGDTRVLNIEELHLHSNDLDALRRLAEADPNLARMVVEQKELADAREHASYRFGIASSALLAIGILVALSYVLLSVGIALALVLLAGILAMALLVRVLLTGEWSETSWVGTLIEGIVKVLGGRPKE